MARVAVGSFVCCQPLHQCQTTLVTDALYRVSLLLVQAFYEAANSGPVAVTPLAPYVSDIQCPFPKPSGGDMNLPSWVYSPQTGKCYYKSSFAKGISGNINDATRRCTVSD